MADKQINDLDVGTPSEDDEFVIQRTGGGLSRKYTLDAIRTAIRAVTEAHSTSSSVQTISTTPAPITGFDTSLVSSGITMVIDAGTATATIDPNKGDPYRVTFDASISSSDDFTAIFTLYKNGVPTHISIQRKLVSGGGDTDEGSTSFNTLINLIPADELEMYIETDAGTANITYVALNLTLTRG